MNELDNINFIFSDQFKETKEFKAWHESFRDCIKLLDVITEKDNYKKPDIHSDEFKDMVYMLKGKHLLRSIELGIYFQKLGKKE